MPLDRLIDLLAEAAVRKLSQEREKKDATPDAIMSVYRKLRPYDVLNCVQQVFQWHRDRTQTST